jgi:hypothetical protein
VGILSFSPCSENISLAKPGFFCTFVARNFGAAAILAEHNAHHNNFLQQEPFYNWGLGTGQFSEAV